MKVVRGKLRITHGGIVEPDGNWHLIQTHGVTNYAIWDEHRLDETNDGEILEYYFALPQILLGHVLYPKSLFGCLSFARK